jgi:hypothetical protein
VVDWHHLVGDRARSLSRRLWRPLSLACKAHRIQPRPHRSPVTALQMPTEIHPVLESHTSAVSDCMGILEMIQHLSCGRVGSGNIEFDSTVPAPSFIMHVAQVCSSRAGPERIVIVLETVLLLNTIRGLISRAADCALDNCI